MCFVVFVFGRGVYMIGMSCYELVWVGLGLIGAVMSWYELV